MKKLQLKTKISTISIILMLAVSTLLIALPIAIAQDRTDPTFPYLGVSPNPIGVNQQVLFHVGISAQRTNVALGWEGL